MNCIVVLQARSSSTRLPGKSLLHFRGLPLVVLAAKRAGSTGIPVIVATSDDPSDDVLASTLAEYGVACGRGSLEDVLGRFVQLLTEYPDDTLVVRLTGDNVVPDGMLIKDVVEFYLSESLDYVTTATVESGLPYGVAVEVTRLAHLREANRNAVTKNDREHVTSYISRTFGATVFSLYRHLGRGHFRTTVDCLDDVSSLHRIFPENEDPIAVPWHTLVDRAQLGLFQPTDGAPVAKLVLGTAQLGMPYGIANVSDVHDRERRDMIKVAIGEGMQALDTAAAYERSEELIGSVMATGWSGRCKVITKLSPLSEISDSASEQEVAAKVEAGVLRSLLSLRQSRIDTLLLHRVKHLTAWGGAAWRTLLGMQANGQIGTLGVSVQSPDELLFALNVPNVIHIQLPFNLLDHRWKSSLGILRDARSRSAITVHARSALLQGLLGSEDFNLWRRAHVNDPGSLIGWLSTQAAEHGRYSVNDLCLAYVRSQDWIDGVVVGCDNLAQVKQNVALFRAPLLSEDACEKLLKNRPYVRDESLDPASWRGRA